MFFVSCSQREGHHAINSADRGETLSPFKAAELRKGLEGCNEMKGKPCRVRAGSSISVTA